MKPYPLQFLGEENEYTAYRDAAVVILPVPWEGGISYMPGTSRGPDAMLKASGYLEFYDEQSGSEPHRCGIATVAMPRMPENPGDLAALVFETARDLLDADKFTIMAGGDHSITTGYARALLEKHGTLSVIQLDAHADLRDTFEDSPFSHACTMRRIRELTPHTLQLGIRSMSREEADLVKAESIPLFTMPDIRSGRMDLEKALAALPDPVFITLDVDVFDWSVIRATGTPEPGGMLWDEMLTILHRIFSTCRVSGMDVVELIGSDSDPHAAFAAAKLIYKCIAFQTESAVMRGELPGWPESPAGPLFRIHS